MGGRYTRKSLICLIFNFFDWILGSGRCPSGEISNFYLRWAPGEPEMIFLSPKGAPGHWIVHIAMSYVHKRKSCLFSKERLCPVFRGQTVSCVQTRHCVLYSEERLCLVFKGKTVSCLQRRDCVLCSAERPYLVESQDICLDETQDMS